MNCVCGNRLRLPDEIESGQCAECVEIEYDRDDSHARMESAMFDAD